MVQLSEILEQRSSQRIRSVQAERSYYVGVRTGAKNPIAILKDPDTGKYTYIRVNAKTSYWRAFYLLHSLYGENITCKNIDALLERYAKGNAAAFEQLKNEPASQGLDDFSLRVLLLSRDARVKQEGNEQTACKEITEFLTLVRDPRDIFTFRVDVATKNELFLIENEDVRIGGRTYPLFVYRSRVQNDEFIASVKSGLMSRGCVVSDSTDELIEFLDRTNRGALKAEINLQDPEIEEYRKLLVSCGYEGHDILQDLVAFINRHAQELSEEKDDSERVNLNDPELQRATEQRKECERVLGSIIAGQDNKEKFLQVLYVILSRGEKNFSPEAIARAAIAARKIINDPEMAKYLLGLEGYFKASTKGKVNNEQARLHYVQFAVLWEQLANGSRDTYAGDGIDRRSMLRVIITASTAFSAKVRTHLVEESGKSSATAASAVSAVSATELPAGSDEEDVSGRLENVIERSYIFGIKLGIKVKRRPVTNIYQAVLSPSDIREAAIVNARRFGIKVYISAEEKKAIRIAIRSAGGGLKSALQALYDVSGGAGDGLSDRNLVLLRASAGDPAIGGIISKIWNNLEMIKGGLSLASIETLEKLAAELEAGRYKGHCVVDEKGGYLLGSLLEDTTLGATYNEAIKILCRIGWQNWETVSTNNDEEKSVLEEIMDAFGAATRRQTLKINDAVSPIVLTLKSVVSPERAKEMIAAVAEFDRVNGEYERLIAEKGREYRKIYDGLPPEERLKNSMSVAVLFKNRDPQGYGRLLRLGEERGRLLKELQNAIMAVGSDSVDVAFWEAIKTRFGDALRSADKLPLTDQDGTELRPNEPLTLDDGTVVRSRTELIDHVLGARQKFNSISINPGESRDVTLAKKALALVLVSVRKLNRPEINWPSLICATPVGGTSQIMLTALGAAIPNRGFWTTGSEANTTDELLAAQNIPSWQRPISDALSTISMYQSQGSSPVNMSLYMHMLLFRSSGLAWKRMAALLSSGDSFTSLYHITGENVGDAVVAFRELEKRVNMLAARDPGLISAIQKKLTGKERMAVTFVNGRMSFNLADIEELAKAWGNGQHQLMDIKHAGSSAEGYLCAAMIAAFNIEDVLGANRDPGSLATPVSGSEMTREWKALKEQLNATPEVISYVGGGYDHYTPAMSVFLTSAAARLKANPGKFAGRVAKSAGGTVGMFAVMPAMFGMMFIDLAADIMTLDIKSKNDWKSLSKKFLGNYVAILRYGFDPRTWLSMIEERIKANDTEGAIGVLAVVSAFFLYVTYRSTKMVNNFARFIAGRETIKMQTNAFEWLPKKGVGLVGKVIDMVVPREKRYKKLGRKWETKANPALMRHMSIPFEKYIGIPIRTLVRWLTTGKMDPSMAIAKVPSGGRPIRPVRAAGNLVLFVLDEGLSTKFSSYMWGKLSMKRSRMEQKIARKYKAMFNHDINWKKAEAQALNFYGDKIIFVDNKGEVVEREKAAELFMKIKNAFEGRISELTSAELSKYMGVLEEKVLDRICRRPELQRQMKEVIEAAKKKNPKMTEKEIIETIIKPMLRERLGAQIAAAIKRAVLEGRTIENLNPNMPHWQNFLECIGRDADSGLAKLEEEIKGLIERKTPGTTLTEAEVTELEDKVRKAIEKLGGKEYWANEGVRWLKLLNELNANDRLTALSEMVKGMRMQIRESSMPTGLEILMREFVFDQRKMLIEVAKMMRDGRSAAEIDKRIHDMAEKFFAEKAGLIASKVESSGIDIVASIPRLSEVAGDVFRNYSTSQFRTVAQITDDGRIVFTEGNDLASFQGNRDIIEKMFTMNGKPTTAAVLVNGQIIDAPVGYVEFSNIPSRTKDMSISYEIVLPEEGAPISQVKIRIIIYVDKEGIPELFKLKPEEQKAQMEALVKTMGRKNVDMQCLPSRTTQAISVIERLQREGIAVDPALRDALNGSMDESMAERFVKFLKDKKISELDVTNWNKVRAEFFPAEIGEHVDDGVVAPEATKITKMPKEIVDYSRTVVSTAAKNWTEMGLERAGFTAGHAALKERWEALLKKIRTYSQQGKPVPEGLQIEFDALVSNVIRLYSRPEGKDGKGRIPTETAEIILRDYQIQGAKILSDRPAVSLKLPTSMGKTYVSLAEILRRVFIRGNRNIHFTTSIDHLANTAYTMHKPVLDFFGVTSACIDGKLDGMEQLGKKRIAYGETVNYMTDARESFDLESNWQASDPRFVFRRDLPDAVVRDEHDTVRGENYIMSGSKEGSGALPIAAFSQATSLVKGVDYTVDMRSKKAYFTEAGMAKLASCTPEMRAQVLRSIIAIECYQENVEVILDRETGEVTLIERGKGAKGKRLQDGLHEALEVRFGKIPEGKSSTNASVTSEQLNRLLLERGSEVTGMTATPEKVRMAIPEGREGIEFEVFETTADTPANRDVREPVFFRSMEALFERNLEICRGKGGESVLLFFEDAKTAEAFRAFAASKSLSCSAVTAVQVGVDATGAKEYAAVRAAIEGAKGKGVVTVSTELTGRGANWKNIDTLNINFLTDSATEEQLKGRAGGNRIRDGRGKVEINRFYNVANDGLINNYGESDAVSFIRRFGFAPDQASIGPDDAGYEALRKWAAMTQAKAEISAEQRSMASEYFGNIEYPHMWGENGFITLKDAIRNAKTPAEAIAEIVCARLRSQGKAVDGVRESVIERLGAKNISLSLSELQRVLIDEVINKGQTEYLSGKEEIRRSGELKAGPNSNHAQGQHELYLRTYSATLDIASDRLCRMDAGVRDVIVNPPQADPAAAPAREAKPATAEEALEILRKGGVEVVTVNGAFAKLDPARMKRFSGMLKRLGVNLIAVGDGVELDVKSLEQLLKKLTEYNVKKGTPRTVIITNHDGGNINVTETLFNGETFGSFEEVVAHAESLGENAKATRYGLFAPENKAVGAANLVVEAEAPAATERPAERVVEKSPSAFEEQETLIRAISEYVAPGKGAAEESYRRIEARYGTKTAMMAREIVGQYSAMTPQQLEKIETTLASGLARAKAPELAKELNIDVSKAEAIIRAANSHIRKEAGVNLIPMIAGFATMVGVGYLLRKYNPDMDESLHFMLTIMGGHNINKAGIAAINKVRAMRMPAVNPQAAKGALTASGKFRVGVRSVGALAADTFKAAHPLSMGAGLASQAGFDNAMELLGVRKDSLFRTWGGFGAFMAPDVFTCVIAPYVLKKYSINILPAAGGRLAFAGSYLAVVFGLSFGTGLAGSAIQSYGAWGKGNWGTGLDAYYRSVVARAGDHYKDVNAFNWRGGLKTAADFFGAKAYADIWCVDLDDANSQAIIEGDKRDAAAMEDYLKGYLGTNVFANLGLEMMMAGGASRISKESFEKARAMLKAALMELVKDKKGKEQLVAMLAFLKLYATANHVDVPKELLELDVNKLNEFTPSDSLVAWILQRGKVASASGLQEISSILLQASAMVTARREPIERVMAGGNGPARGI